MKNESSLALSLPPPPPSRPPPLSLAHSSVTSRVATRRRDATGGEDDIDDVDDDESSCATPTRGGGVGGAAPESCALACRRCFFILRRGESGGTADVSVPPPPLLAPSPATGDGEDCGWAAIMAAPPAMRKAAWSADAWPIAPCCPSQAPEDSLDDDELPAAVWTVTRGGGDGTRRPVPCAPLTASLPSAALSFAAPSSDSSVEWAGERIPGTGANEGKTADSPRPLMVSSRNRARLNALRRNAAACAARHAVSSSVAAFEGIDGGGGVNGCISALHDMRV